MVRENPRQWDLVLAHAEFAYNRSHSRTTGKTPFEIVNGVNPITPLDLTPLVVEKHLSSAAEDHAQDVKQLHQQVREHIEKQYKKYKEQVDKRRKKVIFKEGDLVWIQLGKDRFPAGRFVNGKATSAWFDKWHPSGQLGAFFSKRNIQDARFNLTMPVNEVIEDEGWLCPQEWMTNNGLLHQIDVPALNKSNKHGQTMPFSVGGVWNDIRNEGNVVPWIKVYDLPEQMQTFCDQFDIRMKSRVRK
ncbi:RNA-directed DNA polymerase [Tanacetum coccineum]